MVTKYADRETFVREHAFGGAGSLNNRVVAT